MAICLTMAIMLITQISRGQQNAAISGTKFLQDATTAGMNSISLGQLGQKRLQDEQILNYVVEMLNAQTASNVRLAMLAKKKKIKLPDLMSIPINSMQNRADTALTDTTAADSVAKNFDSEFLQMAIDDLKKAIALYERGSGTPDKDIRAFAGKQLPELRKRLSKAEQLVAQALPTGGQ